MWLPWLLGLLPMMGGAAELPATQNTSPPPARTWPPLARLEAATRALLPRAGMSAAEVRWRFPGGCLYVLGTGGTRRYPEVEGTFRPGALASVGLGVEHAR